MIFTEDGPAYHHQPMSPGMMDWGSQQTSARKGPEMAPHLTDWPP